MGHRILLLEDDLAVRQSLINLIDQTEDLELVGSCGSMREGTCLLALDPDFLLVDLMLEDGKAFEFITQAKTGRKTRVLVISSLGDEASVIGAIQAGADGYIKKEATQAELSNAIDAVLSGDSPMSPSIARHLLRKVRGHAQPSPDIQDSDTKPLLSQREIQVLEALAQGLNYKEVARRYDLSHHTIAKYIKTVYRKLSVNSRAEAVVKGMKAGLIDTADS